MPKNVQKEPSPLDRSWKLEVGGQTMLFMFYLIDLLSIFFRKITSIVLFIFPLEICRETTSLGFLL